jgi:hypothetical protein
LGAAAGVKNPIFPKNRIFWVPTPGLKKTRAWERGNKDHYIERGLTLRTGLQTPSGTDFLFFYRSRQIKSITCP